MSTQLHFELVSPEKLVLSKGAAMVTVPGGEGEYGVLPGHAPMITTLQAGVIDIYEQSDSSVSDRIFVAGGFAEVTEERCTVLAEEAVPLSEIDRTAVEEQVRALTDSLASVETDAARAASEAQLAVATAKLQALGRAA